ncbi:leucine rich [Trypanosoma conorhini]|uniref:Leucine rich n=1 Tax=Trypanosoma conorhini TaxID=83891 RepID=A0A422PSB0_9TRYP|nr:leucine rich [Trypanosoma conorhini]RNF20649.1 leucine rich [Trypanosoma conorhini]
MARVQSEAAEVYVEACSREHAECALELVEAFENNDKEANLSDRSVHLNDLDVGCIAEALRSTAHSIRVLNLEGNAFGLTGLQRLLEAVEKNPGTIRELRLGRNKLKDQAAVVIGHTLSRDGCGLKVLDLSENDITKLGVIPIAAALGNESCDIVELSFHNNKIEADAATYLGQAIRHAGKLRHLHLGYNSIRDTGAAQLAQCIPLTVTLSTLDLTANRIGPSGGRELARALMTSSCNIQRLNLRHNLFDSATIEMYAEVLQTNTSLIQLFLGFMNPTPDAAAVVLSALRANRTLLLLDIYGWKLSQEVAWRIIDSVQKTNGTVAAIVTDACQGIARRVDEGNDERDERGLHPVYVGPDDRDAYMATKSLRRFSRAQSRRQSRASSRGAMSSRTGSPSNRRMNERSHSCRDSDAYSRHSSRGLQEAPYQVPRQGQGNAARQELQQDRRTMSGPREPAKSVPREPAKSVPREPAMDGPREPAKSMPREPAKSVPREPAMDGPREPTKSMPREPAKSVPREKTPTQLEDQSEHVMRQMVEQLRVELAEQRRKQLELEFRVAALEKRRECSCGCNTAASESDPAQVSRVAVVGSSGGAPLNHCNDAPNGHDSKPPSDARVDGCVPQEANPPFRPSTPSGAQTPAESTERTKNAGPVFSEARQNGTAASTAVAVAAALRGGASASGGSVPPLQPSVARTERSEPPAEPLELPREQRPAEATLQKSTKQVENYQPRLAPSPSKDNDPPRRKGSIRAV